MDDDMSTNETSDPGESRIDRLMREQDLTREQAQAAVETVQAGSDEPTICTECGQPRNHDEERAVAQYPDPVDGEQRVLCSECFADRVSELTLLSPQQAKILAFDLADWRSKDIQDALGIESVGLSGQRSRTKQKFTDAVDQLEEAQRTIFVLEALNPEPADMGGSR